MPVLHVNFAEQKKSKKEKVIRLPQQNHSVTKANTKV